MFIMFIITQIVVFLVGALAFDIKKSGLDYTLWCWMGTSLLYWFMFITFEKYGWPE